MPGRRNRVAAMEMIQAERAKIRRGEVNGYGAEAVEYWLGVAEEALAEAAREIVHYKGMLAARDGREIILTFDRIGTEGVPTHFEDGTRLKCTDSDRQWVLSDGKWEPWTPTA